MSEKTKQKMVSLSLPVLSKGNKGEIVRVVQTLLKENGYKVGMTGNFGEGTQRRLKEAQEAWGIPVTGKTDKETWEALLGVR